MAETAVGLVVDNLISLLSSEVNLLRGVHREIHGIKDHLRSIQAFLKDADARAEAEDGQVVKLWVDELREVSLQIEIVIDEYAYYFAERRQHPRDQRSLRLRLRLRLVYLLRKASCSVTKLSKRHAIASKIRDLKDRVEDVNKRSAAYKFADAGSGSGGLRKTWSDPRDDSRFLRETEVVGIQKEKDEVVTLISGVDQHAVVAIVGMGGIGKTTLANQVYEKVKASFDCHAWITVSQTYNKADLLKSLIKGLYKSANETAPQGIEQETDLFELSKALRDYVQGKNYFVSFDDVWETNFWADIKNGLPSENGKRGRIVITTRDLRVANACKMSTSLYTRHMDLLNFDDSWKLFCGKAFHSTPGNICPPHMHDLSQAVVRRCEGWPLAIVVIGGLLATKNENIEEWRSLVTKFASELESNNSLKSINKILSLSFNDLPYNLKPCLLYFGIFPEDYSIRSSRLIRQWIAEGFVKPEKDKTLEEVAGRYLMELINRSIIHAPEIDSTGRVKSCRVHDLVRDFIVTKMEDLKFCVLSGNNSYLFSELTTRRISIFNAGSAIGSSDTLDIGSCYVGSVFMFDKDGEMCNSLLATMTKSFRLLKLLDFEDAKSLDHLPDDIGNLYLLRYLSLQRTGVKSIPKSIGKLENLETLDLKFSEVRELPNEINMLSKLTNLMATDGVKLEKGFGCLKSLLKLYWIECGVDTLEELSKLTELRKLGICNLRSEDGQALCRCIQSLKQLRTFKVRRSGLLNLESMSSLPKFLRRLLLRVPLTKLPGWVAELQCLAKIELYDCKLEDNLLEPLQDLPNLLVIRMFDDAYYGEKLRFATGKFKKLEVLSVSDLSRLKWLEIEQGSLPNLKQFHIWGCPQMKEMFGFPHLKTLQVVRFTELPTEFLLSQDFQSLTSVPDIQFHYFIFFYEDFKFITLTLSWVMMAQGCVPEEEKDKQQWFSLDSEQLYRKVEKIQSSHKHEI